MTAQMTDEEIRNKATQKVRVKMSFFIHLTVYLLVNAFLWIIWLVTSGGPTASMWPLFPTIGWGIAIVIHGITTFAFHSDWEDREVEKEISRMKKSGDS